MKRILILMHSWGFKCIKHRGGREAASGGLLWKRCSWTFHKIRRKTLVLEPQACKFIKRQTLAQVFSREFCEIFKNTFIYRTPPDDCFRRYEFFLQFFPYGISPGDCFEHISSRKALQKVFKKCPRKHPWNLKKFFF